MLVVMFRLLLARSTTHEAIFSVSMMLLLFLQAEPCLLSHSMRLVRSSTMAVRLVLVAITEVFGASSYASTARLVGLSHLQDAVTILSASLAQHLRHGLRRSVAACCVRPLLALLRLLVRVVFMLLAHRWRHRSAARIDLRSLAVQHVSLMVRCGLKPMSVRRSLIDGQP